MYICQTKLLLTDRIGDKKMKRLILITLAIMLLAMPAMATIPSNLEIFDETEVGAKVDLPNLFVKKGAHSLGGELEVRNLFERWSDSLYVGIKYTYRGSLCDLDKKK